MLIWHLVKPLVHWTVAERQQRLFWLAVQVQATLMTRYPGYQTPTVHTVPDALAAEVTVFVKERLRVTRYPGRSDASRGEGAAPDAAGPA